MGVRQRRLHVLEGSREGMERRDLTRAALGGEVLKQILYARRPPSNVVSTTVEKVSRSSWFMFFFSVTNIGLCVVLA